jgi:hypothetical protein
VSRMLRKLRGTGSAAQVPARVKGRATALGRRARPATDKLAAAARERAARARPATDKLAAAARERAARARPATEKLAAAAKDRAVPMAAQARTWTAERLDKSSAAVQETLAPRLSRSLTSAARKVRPAKPRPSLIGKLLRAAGLIGVLGIAAATAIAMRNRMSGSAPAGTSAMNGKAGRTAKTGQSSAEASRPNADVGGR